MPAMKGEILDEPSRADSQSTEMSDAGVAIKQVLEKKIRNLEKRRAKLVQLKEDMEKGKDVHPDQKKAAMRITQVDEQIEFSRDMLKNVVSIIQACNKTCKAMQRKASRERNLAERSRLRDLMNLQELLNMLGSEDVRNCFAEGSRGTVMISSGNLLLLDYLYQKICPSHDDLASSDSWMDMLEEAAEYASLLVGRSPKVIPNSKVTFKEAREILEEIENCEFYKRRIQFVKGKTEDKQTPTKDISIKSGEELSRNLGALSMSNGSNSYESDVNIASDMVSHAHSRMNFVQDEQSLMTGAASPYGPVSFVPVGMNTVYQMPVGNIYTQAPLPIPASHMVYASAVDVKNNIINESSATRFQQQQQVQNLNAEQNSEEQSQNSAFNVSAATEDVTERAEDDLSGFQDVRSSRSKMRREKMAQRTLTESGGTTGGGRRGGVGGEYRARGARGSGPPYRGRRAGGFNHNPQRPGGGLEGTIGRWGDDQEARNNSGSRGRGRSSFYRNSYGQTRNLTE